MIQVTYSYKDREFLQWEDSIINQLAESARSLLYALLEPLRDLLLQESGRININLDQQPRIELLGFSRATQEQIEMMLRGEA